MVNYKGQWIVRYRHNVGMKCQVLKPYHHYRRWVIFNEDMDRVETIGTEELKKCERWS